MARNQPRYREAYDGYYSDDSTFVDSHPPPHSRRGSRNDYGYAPRNDYDYARRYPPRSRSRSPPPFDSFENQHPRQSQQNDSQQKTRGKHDTLIKVVVAVGILQLVAGVMQLLSTRKAAKRDEEERRWRRREFEKRKRERRRDEEALARQREMDMAQDRDREAPLPRARITGPPSRTHSSAARERVRRGRLIEPSPSDVANMDDRP